MKKSILFIINPISGGKNKKHFPALVEEYLDRAKFDSQCVFTENEGHAGQLAESAKNQNVNIVVSVGGDGTMNEIASVVDGTDTALAIVPFGSGNGLARSLQIPMDRTKAILKLNELNYDTIDSGILNGKKFFNMAGMGFDAAISSRFAKDKTRGFSGYFKTTLQEIASYKPQQYKIEVDGIAYEGEAFMLNIANSSQFGNNAHVSPTASVRDGLLDVCIIKPFPLYIFPLMVYYMFSKTADTSSLVKIIKGKNIRILRERAGPIHLDGEPRQMGEDIRIEVKPLSLKVLK